MAIAPAEFAFIKDLVMTSAAIDLEAGKEYLVESRLTPLAQKLGLGSLAGLIEKLRSGPQNGLHSMVVEAMTTNETSFFRDIHPFEALKKNIFPDLIAKRANERTLRIWSAACSSGQEPYTMSLILREFCPQAAGWKIQILATDLSREVLAKARAGVYNQFEMNRGMPAVFMVRYFTKIGDTWQLREDVRNCIEFQEFNLAKPFPLLPRFDLILLRNVLIYFNLETKRNIFAKMRNVMAPDAYMMLGSAETTMNIDDNFESITYGKSTVYRKRA